MYIFRCQDNKDELESTLVQEMHGIQRVPALCFANPSATLEELNLANYEVLGCEPLHDVTGHIKNLFDAIPIHLNKAEKELFQNMIGLSFEGRDAKRGCDHRAALVKITKALDGKINTTAHQILLIMCEIQDILYSREENRTNQTILRLHNLTFSHAILLNKYFKDTNWKGQKTITKRKLFGKYFHAITNHSSQQFRILSGRSANTEQEERTFSYLKLVSATTSNHNADNVILNAMIRTQAREMINGNSPNKDQDSEIAKLYSPLKVKRTETKFSYKWIEKNKHTYQAHLEHISDFLVEERVYWKESMDGIVFHDLSFIPSQKKKHNFRSWTLHKEYFYLKYCWDIICIPQSDKLIPTCSVKIEDEKENISIKQINSLNYFVNHSDIQLEHDETILKPQTSTPLSKMHEEEIHEEEYEVDEEVILSLQPVMVMPPPFENISHALQMSNPKIVPQQINLVTKTGKILKEILGMTPEVKRYDTLRNSYKLRPSNFKKVELQKLHTSIEKSILHENDRLKCELNKLEESIIETREDISVVSTTPKEKEKENYFNKKLKYIRLLRTEFKI